MNLTTHISMGACHSPMGGSASTPPPPTLPVDKCTSVNGSEGPSLVFIVVLHARQSSQNCSVDEISGTKKYILLPILFPQALLFWKFLQNNVQRK